MKTQRSFSPVLILAILATLALAASSAFADLTVLMPYGTTALPSGTPGYKYSIQPINSAIPGFEAVTFPDALWADGGAPFGGAGNRPEVCSGLWPQVVTPWSPNNSDLFARFHVDMCAGVTSVRVGVSIDNDLALFVNGFEIEPVSACAVHSPDGLCQTENCAYQDKLVFDVPDGLIVSGDNVFAIHARDRHVVAFLDVQVSADLTNQICEPPNDPPDCSDAFASPDQLWPPNHKWNAIAIGGVTDPNGDEVAVTIDGIFQDEPTDARGNGDGNTCPDGSIGTAGASVRAERAGGADGRVYHIGFTATDPTGGSCQGRAAVCVPHDQGQGNHCIDQGPLFNSTLCP